MAEDEVRPKLGRIRDASRTAQPRLRRQVFQQAGKAGLRARWSKGHVKPGALTRGMGTGVRAAAGLIAPGSRRVVVKARYTRIINGDLGAARAHLKYIQRDGVTREDRPGSAYDANRDDVDQGAFLDRSKSDPHQFRIILSPEDGDRLHDLKPLVRDLLGQMERDLGTRLDWVAVDHFNTGHPHSHIVIRGRDDQGRDLVMARDYIGHGIRARAQGLITLELGPETTLERLRKQQNEIGLERLTSLDRSILARARDSIIVMPADVHEDRQRATLRLGRLKTLERLGLAEERQTGVWQLDPGLETKLRQLGDRADTVKMMQRALKEAGIDRAASALALFEKGPRKVPLIGKVVGVGIVDEITDRTWVIVDAVDGRVHYADLGRLSPDAIPERGIIAALAGGHLDERPSTVARLHVLSPAPLDRLPDYDGPTWLDEAILSKWQPEPGMPGAAVELSDSLAARGRWLAGQGLATVDGSGEISPRPNMLANLRQRETKRLAAELSAELKAEFVPRAPGDSVHGVYVRSIDTATGKQAVIRSQDTFTLAPWKPALEPMRGLAVIGTIGRARVAWSFDRGRDLPPRG